MSGAQQSNYLTIQQSTFFSVNSTFKLLTMVNRRKFLQSSGLLALPALIPATGFAEERKQPQGDDPVIRFFFDGDDYSPASYIDALQKINAKQPIQRDSYTSGGTVEAMEKKFVEITGKERAIFMPTGTLANQLAISVLSGEKTKVYVQDTSHVYRDEADAAQSVFEKRFMPLAMGQPYFTAAQLKEAIDSLQGLEVFSSGIGAVSIENPVRRAQGRMVPIEEIRKISEYCRANNIKLHLDGARLHMAAAWSGISIKEFASYFDTVYISLYKYLGAPAGAVLCGDNAVISKMPHLIKIHGATIYSAWPSAAMVLSKLETIDATLKDAVQRSIAVFAELNKLPGFSVKPLDGGTNIYELELGNNIDGRKMRDRLNKEFNIRIPGISDRNKSLLTVNETILYRDASYVVNAFAKSIKN
jgi:threonine aldolase